MKQQRSCLDLNKFKFIPPSKLLQVKPQPSPPLPLHFQSLAQDPVLEDTPLFDRHSRGRENKENVEQASRNMVEMVRCVSNPKLVKSNSRNAMLKMKNPPIEVNKVEQTHQNHFAKLTQYIEQLKIKNSTLGGELAELKQHNECLNDKLNKAGGLLALKNKQISQLGLRLKDMEQQAKQKCEQHSLIIESLKKVIESQQSKITELINKSNREPRIAAKNSKKYEYIYESDQSSQEEPDLGQQSSRIDDKIESLLYDQPSKGRHEPQDPSQIENLLGELSQQQEPTPNFGARTPKDSLLTTCKEAGIPSLECSLQQPANMSLSRISESAEEDYETERSSRQCEANAMTGTSMSTHQQLLDEIDQYLLKRNKNNRK